MTDKRLPPIGSNSHGSYLYRALQFTKYLSKFRMLSMTAGGWLID